MLAWPGKKMKQYKICITGGIACGKSSAGAALRESGVRIIDADAVCHELFRKEGPLLGRIISVFGTKILGRDGAIDRRVLGRIVFADKEKREKLNALVHPEARRVINAWLKTPKAGRDENCGRKNVRENIAAAIIPLAYEAGWERGWDAVICVAAPLSLQISRLKRKGFSEMEIRSRIAAQMPLTEKMSKADYVIFNAGTIAGLRRQTALVFRSIKKQPER